MRPGDFGGFGPTFPIRRCPAFVRGHSAPTLALQPVMALVGRSRPNFVPSQPSRYPRDNLAAAPSRNATSAVIG